MATSVAAGLNVLNQPQDYDISTVENSMHIENEESYVSNDTQKFGYNSHLAEDTNPLQKVEQYYQNLGHGHQSQILSFLHGLTSELHCYSYSRSSCQTPVEIESEQKKIVIDEAERKRPLIAGKKPNTYDDVVVNQAKLRSAEMWP